MLNVQTQAVQSVSSAITITQQTRLAKYATKDVLLALVLQSVKAAKLDTTSYLPQIHAHYVRLVAQPATLL